MSGGGDAHEGHGAEFGNEVAQQSRARGGAEFALDRSVGVGGDAFEQAGRCRSRNGHDAVGASNASKTDMDWRGHYFFRGNSRLQIAAGDDVRDGVDRPDLMEVNEVDAAPMGAAFGLGEKGIDGASVVCCPVHEREIVDDGNDV